MTLGERILKYRATNDLSMHALAKMCRVSKQTIFLIERHNAKPSALTLAKIELVIGKEKED